MICARERLRNTNGDHGWGHECWVFPGVKVGVRALQRNTAAVGPLFVSRKIHVLKPNPQCDGNRRWGLLGGGGKGGWLGRKDETLMNGFSAQMKEAFRELLVPSTMWAQWAMAVYETENSPHQALTPPASSPWAPQPPELWDMSWPYL